MHAHGSREQRNIPVVRKLPYSVLNWRATAIRVSIRRLLRVRGLQHRTPRRARGAATLRRRGMADNIALPRDLEHAPLTLLFRDGRAVFLQDLLQRRPPNRLGQEVVHAAGHAFIFVALLRERRQCHDGGREAHFSDQFRGLDAVEIWHLHVHEDKVEGVDLAAG